MMYIDISSASANEHPNSRFMRKLSVNNEAF